jgi:hypothetical protein
MNSRPIIERDHVTHYMLGVGVVDKTDPECENHFGFKFTMCRVHWERGGCTWEPEFILSLIPTQPLKGE